MVLNGFLPEAVQNDFLQQDHPKALVPTVHYLKTNQVLPLLVQMFSTKCDVEMVWTRFSTRIGMNTVFYQNWYEHSFLPELLQKGFLPELVWSSFYQQWYRTSDSFVPILAKISAECAINGL